MRDRLEIDGWQVDLIARTAERQSVTEHLSPRAIRLLQVFAESDSCVVSREALLNRVWPNVIVSDESLTQVVSEVRRKLANRQLIVTIARAGYRLTVPVVLADETPRTFEPHGLTLHAYTLCVEAKACFSMGHEGAHRAFVSLTAEAVRAGPGFADAHALHALALYKRHLQWSEGDSHLDEIVQAVANTLAIDPNHALAHMLDGAVLFMRGAQDGGMRAIERALAKAMTDAFIHFNAGVILLSAGHRRAAAALVARAAELSPDRFGADVLSARIHLATDPERARIAAERALAHVKQELDINPQSMRALYALGPLLAQLGDTRGAQAALEGVTHHDSPAEYFRALGFAQIGDFSSALERLDFLAMRGWRHGEMLRHEPGFAPLLADKCSRKLQREILVA
ncbi:MAG: winged helix-turn-helix domain-containing protein [Pseudomonadota bacterium]